MTTYTATIQFTADDPCEALRAMQCMRETFCNDDTIKELTASLVDSNFTQWIMVRNGVEQPLNPGINEVR